jgi:hypothetical protein
MEIVLSCGEKKLFSANSVARKVSSTISIANASSNGKHYSGLRYVTASDKKEAYYHLGVKIQGVYLNLYFYGLTSADFGRTRTFDVEVFEKNVDEKTHRYINLYKVSLVPMYDLKLGMALGEVEIIGTDSYIRFEPRQALLNMARTEEDLDREFEEQALSAYREEELDREIDKLINAW